jgi:protein TonB
MGPGVEPPKLVRFVKPGYPPIARRLRVEGEVVVSVLVDETGKVADARIVRSATQDVGLEEAALAAARSASFQPATKDGVRVKMWTTLRIPFQL